MPHLNLGDSRLLARKTSCNDECSDRLSSPAAPSARSLHKGRLTALSSFVGRTYGPEVSKCSHCADCVPACHLKQQHLLKPLECARQAVSAGNECAASVAWVCASCLGHGGGDSTLAWPRIWMNA